MPDQSGLSLQLKMTGFAAPGLLPQCPHLDCASAIIVPFTGQDPDPQFRDYNYNPLAMRAADVDEKTAKIMYGAVYLFGPRWGPGTAPGQRNAPVDATLEQQERVLTELQALVEQDNPTSILFRPKPSAWAPSCLRLDADGKFAGDEKGSGEWFTVLRGGPQQN